MSIFRPRPHRAVILLAFVLGWAAAQAAGQPDVLRPEQAFRYQATAEGDDIVVRWTIEPGYYLYKERMGYASRTPAVTLGPASLPAGLPYQDEFFGDMEIYRNEALVRIPVTGAGGRDVELEIRSQGCADIGLCYPPQTWRANVALPGAARAQPAAAGLAGLLGRPAAPDAPLPVEQAFRVSAALETPELLQVSWVIAPGYYLYRENIAIESASPAVSLGTPRLPAGVPKEDEYFGATQVFYEEALVDVPVSGRADPLQLRISYQGCKEESICYPPQTVLLTVAADGGGGTLRADPPPMVSEQDQLATMIGTGNLALVMLSFAGLGLLLSFTPCCLPMIPILSGIIVGQGKSVTATRGFLLSLTYVLGMALTYTAAGALFAAAGQQIQAALQQTWIIIAVTVLFVVLALAMFGAWELRLPAFLVNRLDVASGRQKAGTFFGTAVMGAISALVVTTCVAPPLVAALTVIAGTGDVTRGALALFALSLGMGLPLLVIGTSAGRLVPKAGAWMNTVKGAFGFMMLGLAVWMLDRILPDTVTMFLWAALVFMAGVFLGAFQGLDPAASVPQRLAKGAGLLAAIYGVALLAGALAGGQDPLRPLAVFQSSGVAREESSLPFRRVKTVAEFDAAAAAASTAGQPLMLDFYADWCTSCLEMERYTFPDPAVRAALAGAVLLQADVTANDAADKALLARFGIFGPPTIVFLGADGREREGYRVVGFKSAAEFATHARSAFGN
jgi:thiol:disulfide interchange protein DsbD